MNADAARSARDTALIVCALIALRLICAAVTPLAFDEAYYWTWSKHLAGGYYDHPPMVAWIIRAGTLMAGDTEIGVRLVSILLAAPMSFAVYRAAAILFDGRRIAADATIFLNATLMVAAGTLIVTPDAPLMAASGFVLFFLAKVSETGRGGWWLAAGAAVGVALLSKYTALFFGPVILIWLAVSTAQRRWLASPWPYLGGLVALAVFAPVIWWNAEHDWVSFIKQFGRARTSGLTPRYIVELIPAQFALATPPVFILGVSGMYLLAARRVGTDAARILITATIGVIVLYFLWHALHARVEANWFAPIYPAFAVAAAVAAQYGGWSLRAQRHVDRCRRFALPLGVAMFVLLVVQANTGWLTATIRDGTARTIGVGWRELGAQIEAIRVRENAVCIVGGNYATTSWLAFYLPPRTCVVSRVERIRWTGEPDGARLRGRLLFVDRVAASGQSVLADHPGYIGPVEKLQRRRGGLIIDRFQLDLIDGSKADVLERLPPIELR